MVVQSLESLTNADRNGIVYKEMAKQLDTKKLETTKQDFENLLKKASEQKPKPSTKSSKT